MPDIAMCQQHECALWQSCYRYRAVPSEYQQSYIAREPAERQEDGTHFCEDYYPLIYRQGSPVRSIKELQEAAK